MLHAVPSNFRLRARQLAFDAPTGLIWSLPTVPQIHLIGITSVASISHRTTPVIRKNLDFMKLFGSSGFNQTLFKGQEEFVVCLSYISPNIWFRVIFPAF